MTVQEFNSALFEIRINAHIAHLQTTNYASHMALGSLYESIVELQDSFTESYQGKYGIIEGYPDVKINEGVDMVKYLTIKTTSFQKYRDSLTDGFLQNIVDTIIELLYSTLYKLKNLS
jgi:hypothetical protein